MSSSNERNTVVITGLGLATPLGLDLDTVWSRISQSETAIKPMPHYLPGRGGAMLEDFYPEEHVRPKRILRFVNRATSFAMVAARNALEDAGVSEGVIDPERFGIYTGTGESEMKPEIYFPALEKAIDEQGQFNLAQFAQEGLDQLDPYVGLTSLGNNALCYISIVHKLMGPSNNYVKSGVASSQAIAEAVQALRYGLADAILVVGNDWLTDPWALAAYDSIGMLCTDCWDVAGSMRPFDAGRRGPLPGEGAGALVLETAQVAEKRGAHIYGQILGYGEATDTWSFGAPPPDGGVLPLAIEEALADAQVTPEQVDLIIAHGNSSPGGDTSEAQGIYHALSGRLRHVPITSTKPYTGHLGAASGTVETILALLMQQHATVPPILNLTEPDVACSLNFVMNQSLKCAPNILLHIARSVGGQNAVIIIGKDLAALPGK